MYFYRPIADVILRHFHFLADIDDEGVEGDDFAHGSREDGKIVHHPTAFPALVAFLGNTPHVLPVTRLNMSLL